MRNFKWLTGMAGLGLVIIIGHSRMQAQADPQGSRSGLPFGPKVLLAHDFPDTGFQVPNEGILAPEDMRNQMALHEAWVFFLGKFKYFEDEAEGKSLPKAASFEVISLNEPPSSTQVFTPFLDTNLQLSYDLRLPNRSGKELYLIFTHDNQPGCSEPLNRDLVNACCRMDGYGCNASGVLYVLDKSSRQAQGLEVFFIDAMENAMLYRFFHINKHGLIRIFEGEGDVHEPAEIEQFRTQSTFYVEERYQIRLKRNAPLEIRKLQRTEN